MHGVTCSLRHSVPEWGRDGCHSVPQGGIGAGNGDFRAAGALKRFSMRAFLFFLRGVPQYKSLYARDCLKEGSYMVGFLRVSGLFLRIFFPGGIRPGSFFGIEWMLGQIVSWIPLIPGNFSCGCRSGNCLNDQILFPEISGKRIILVFGLKEEGCEG